MNWRKPVLLLASVIGLPIACCSQKSEDSIAFVNVNLVTMTDESVIEHQTVLVQGSKIVAIGYSDALEIPGGTQVMDGTGAFLMPGLADMHMHIREDWEDQDISSLRTPLVVMAAGRWYSGETLADLINISGPAGRAQTQNR